MATAFNHNKRKNVGLIYELLVRKTARSLVTGDRDTYLSAISAIKSHFSPGSTLHEEKSLFDMLRENRSSNETIALRTLDSLKEAKSYEGSDLRESSRMLLSDVEARFGKTFFDETKVPEYRFFATVHMLLESYRSGKADPSRPQLEGALLKYMTSSPKTFVRPIREDVDGLVASLAMNKFEKKYSEVLGPDQKSLVRAYMDYAMTGDVQKFTRIMETAKKGILEVLRSSKDDPCFKEDKVMASRLSEAVERLEENKELFSESSVTDMLLYQRLAQEIASDDQ